MKTYKILFVCLIILNLSNCDNAASVNKLSDTDKEKLTISINRFNDAFKNGDVTTLQSMITDNYMHTNGNSKSIRKKDWLNYLNKRENNIKLGNIEVINYQMDEVEIEFYENTAIVTGKVEVLNKVKEDIKKNEYRVTNIWVYENENWKRAAFHDGKIE